MRERKRKRLKEIGERKNTEGGRYRVREINSETEKNKKDKENMRKEGK